MAIPSARRLWHVASHDPCHARDRAHEVRFALNLPREIARRPRGDRRDTAAMGVPI
jgi:hypothetical protein